MAEFVDRAVVIETIREEVRRQIAGLGLHKLHVVDMCLVEDAVMKIPAADVRLVVRGKWISDHPRKNFGKEVRLDKDGCPVATCHCSVCGDWLTASDEYPAKGRFCPNCGADMREES